MEVPGGAVEEEVDLHLGEAPRPGEDPHQGEAPHLAVMGLLAMMVTPIPPLFQSHLNMLYRPFRLEARPSSRQRPSSSKIRRPCTT